jgi:hypothetical protein
MGTLIIVIGYHLARMVAPRAPHEGAIITVGQTGAHEADHAAGHRQPHRYGDEG